MRKVSQLRWEEGSRLKGREPITVADFERNCNVTALTGNDRATDSSIAPVRRSVPRRNFVSTSVSIYWNLPLNNGNGETIYGNARFHP